MKNLSYELALLQLAERVGVKQWIGLGSQAEYGPCNKPIEETAPTRPTTLYGVAKLCAFLLARHMSECLGMRCVWLRLFSAYGPMDDPGWMIPYLALRLLRRERPSLTEAEQYWDYLYVTDVAEALYRVATARDVAGVFNLGSGDAHSLRAVIERVRDMIDIRLPLGFGETPYRPDQIMHLQANIAKITGLTGWSPHVTLDDGLRETIAWFRANSWRYDG
jgi:nucleoside-diphosphate-sugar epimerase